MTVFCNFKSEIINGIAEAEIIIFGNYDIVFVVDCYGFCAVERIIGGIGSE